MHYFNEPEHYFEDDWEDEPADKVSKIKPLSTEALCQEIMYGKNYEHEERFYDYDLYANIDKIVLLEGLTSLTIFFTKTEVQEKALAKLSQIKTLTKLKLEPIDFSFDITKVPDSIFTLKTLKNLHISNIKITEIPSAIYHLKNLEILTVIQTEITALPESILELTKLKVLELEINHLTHLPEHIGKLKNLENICVFSNELSELPESIGDLVSLQKLDIRWNAAKIIESKSVAKLKNKVNLEVLTF